MTLWKTTADALRGSDRRTFMARVVDNLGRGGQRFAERVLKWSRKTIRKGKLELSEGPIVDNFSARGRKSSEELLPDLLADIRSIVEPACQTDPTFRSKRLYSPLTAAEVHRRLQSEKNYRPDDLPGIRTISNKLAQLNLRPARIQKCKPQKKIPETDAIFAEVNRVNKEADADSAAVRLSLDCKAVVKIGDFSRGGCSRAPQKALDHDFAPDEKLTPFGILEPETGESHLWFSVGPVTADFMADRLEELFQQLKKRCSEINRIVINADNGPECSGQRTQWLKRLVELSNKKSITVELAYYPPYHSKYNPVERLWGILENHWRGELINSVDKALGLAKTMTYRGINPVVELVRKVYERGVSLSKKEMKPIERELMRKKGLEKYFIAIQPNEQLG